MSPVDSHSKNSGVINYVCFNCYEHRTTRLQRSRTSERALTANAMSLLIKSKPSVNPNGEWKEGKMQQETMQSPGKGLANTEEILPPFKNDCAKTS